MRILLVYIHIVDDARCIQRQIKQTHLHRAIPVHYLYFDSSIMHGRHDINQSQDQKPRISKHAVILQMEQIDKIK